MRLLVIDTALAACTVGLFDDDDCLAFRSELMTRGHQERLGGMTRDVVGDGWGGIDRIGVTIGPGSFTGLRVGLAFAQGLGSALSRPVVGVSTLAGLAASIASPTPVVAVIDARRGQVYLQAFLQGKPLSDPAALSLSEAESAIAALGDPAVHLVGNGVPLIADRFPRALTNELQGPSAEALAHIAVRTPADRAGVFPRPLYLRAPDATPPTRLPGQPRS